MYIHPEDANETFLAPEVSTKGIDEKIYTLAEVVWQLNAAILILYAVHKDLGESLRETLAYESGIGSDFKWKAPTKQKKRNVERDMLYEKDSLRESIFKKMKICAQDGAGDGDQLFNSAMSEVAVMAKLDHVCTAMARTGQGSL